MEKTICCFVILVVFAAEVRPSDYSDFVNPVVTTIDVWKQQRRSGKSRTEPQCRNEGIYVCEEPPNGVSVPLWLSTFKRCSYRNVWYTEQLYRWVAGRGCLLYTPDFLYEGGVNPLNLNAACVYQTTFAPCLELVKKDGTCGCFPFDPSFEEVTKAIRKALIPSVSTRWEQCFYEAANCCAHYMYQDVERNNSTKICETTFDGWTCWQTAQADTVVQEVCSEFAYSTSGPSCDHYSSKLCYPNGTWEIQTDYSSCSVSPRLLRRYQFHVGVLGISSIACLPAIFIFFFYKRLRVTRVMLHRNLLIAIVVRNVIVIIYIDELMNTGDTTMSLHGIGCRVLAVAERVAANAVFLSMMVEGVFLHRLICAVFKTKLNIHLLYGIGGAISMLPVAAWATTMALRNNHSCWLVYTVEDIQWILDAPRIAILLINTALFVDILRVLLTKIRNAENVNQVSTAKATLFLMPLFGTQFLLTAFRPSTRSCLGKQVYYYVSYGVEGLQGFMVATMYCYINKEVRTLMKGSYAKTESAVLSIVRRKTNNLRRMTTAANFNHTLTTGIEIENANNERNVSIRSSGSNSQTAKMQNTATIIDPVYETIQNGIINGGYDALERIDEEVDLNNLPNSEDYYGYTNGSSISVDCQDWIRCVSTPSSSVYENSLNDYEVKYLEQKFPNHHKTRIFMSESNDYKNSFSDTRNNETDYAENQTPNEHKEACSNYHETETVSMNSEDISMFSEIMKALERRGGVQQPNSDIVQLDPDILSPNRDKDDKILFI